MRIFGAAKRAREVKNALARLHWEVEFELIERSPTLDRCLDDFVEAAAIMMNIGRKLEPLLNSDDPLRVTSLRSVAEFYAEYHQVPR